ncbi:MAG TPA: hypothetical protein VF541_02215, partial [Longimicrobium sp.]
RNPHRTVDVFMGMPGVRMVDDGRGGLKIQMAGATPSRTIGELRPQTQNYQVGLENSREAQRAATVGGGGSGVGGLAGMGAEAQNIPASQRAGAGDCQVQFYVDGALFYPTHEGDISSDVPVGLIEALEVYRSVAETPVEFRSGHSAGCGTVVIWTSASASR